MLSGCKFCTFHKRDREFRDVNAKCGMEKADT